VMVAVSFLLLVLSADGKIGRIDGILLLCCFLSYTFWALRRGRRQAEKDQSARGSDQSATGGRIRRSNALSFLLLVLGLALLYQGSLWVVKGAVNGARYLGMSELVVSLTIVAVSTSLPEIATTLAASISKKPDLGVGNVVGSNIFNILVVVGFAGLLAPDGLAMPTESIGVDIPFMIAAAVACLPIFWTGQVISRWEGVLFLASYGCYTVYLILNAIESGMLPFYVSAMTRVVIPIAVALVVTLFFITWIRTRYERS
jgi:cation:H+ antiporter